MANTALVHKKSRLPKFLGQGSWPWWFLAAGCFWAGIQSLAAWCLGARVAPAELFDHLGGSDVPMLVGLVLFALIVWQYMDIRGRMRRGTWALSTTWVRNVVILCLGAVAFTAVDIEENWFVDGYWTRMGERHLLDRIGGAPGIARDSAQLIEKVQNREIPAVSDVVDVNELHAFPALSPWKIQRCVVTPEMPRVIYVLGFHEGITVTMQDGTWQVRHEMFAGHLFWSESVSLKP